MIITKIQPQGCLLHSIGEYVDSKKILQFFQEEYVEENGETFVKVDYYCQDFKTFDDLIFDKSFKGYPQAEMKFDNNYSISVVNFKGKFEVCILKNNSLDYFTTIPNFYTQDGIVANLTPERVTELIQKIEVI